MEKNVTQRDEGGGRGGEIENEYFKLISLAETKLHALKSKIQVHYPIILFNFFPPEFGIDSKTKFSKFVSAQLFVSLDFDEELT